MGKVIEKVKFNVLAETEGAQPLVGQIILEQLDLIVDPGTMNVIPDLRSPEMPMIEVLMATSPDKRASGSGFQPLPQSARTSDIRQTLCVIWGDGFEYDENLVN